MDPAKYLRLYVSKSLGRTVRRVNEGKIPVTRYRVDLLIDFPSSEARDGSSGGFKNGSERVDAWTYKTFVHVYDAEEFMAFVALKYKDTTD